LENLLRWSFFTFIHTHKNYFIYASHNLSSLSSQTDESRPPALATFQYTDPTALHLWCNLSCFANSIHCHTFQRSILRMILELANDPFEATSFLAGLVRVRHCAIVACDIVFYRSLTCRRAWSSLGCPHQVSSFRNQELFTV